MDISKISISAANVKETVAAQSEAVSVREQQPGSQSEDRLVLIQVVYRSSRC